jgi:peptidyl-prolyl cis-trans isomerase SurA
MTSSMTKARYAAGRSAWGAAIMAALMATAASAAMAQPSNAPAPAQAPAAAPAPQPLSEAVAAVVNDDIISTYDLTQRTRLLLATSGAQPTNEVIAQFEREALSSLVDEHLQFQELHRVEKEQKMSVIATDEEVDDDLKNMAQQNNLTREQFVGAMTSQGIGEGTLRQQIRAQISWQRWIRGRYGSRLRIGEDQIKTTQQRLAADASKPQYAVSEVFIDAGRAGGMEQATKGAAQLVGQLQQGAPFPAVARQFSSSPTAAAGGDAGWITPGEMPPEVDAALEQLRPGQLSQPIPVKDGVYIIYLRDKRSGAGGTLVDLKQAAVPLGATASAADEAAARAKLEALRPTIKNCADMEAAAAKVPGVVAGDLGEAEVTDLAPQFREAASTLKVGEISQPIRTAAGLHLVAVCGKRASGGGAIDHDEVENRLFSQQLSMIARRYMRDLRNSATIETR